jgi:DoxX-like family
MTSADYAATTPHDTQEGPDMDIAVIMLSLLLALSSTSGGVAKLAGASIARADAKRLGFTYSTYRIVGALELAAAAGLVALTIGAVLAHRRARDLAAKLAGAGVVAVLALVTAGLQVLANT